jgi:hypothetical protein
MMQILANMSANTTLSRSYDYCVTVLSTSFDLRNLWPGNSIDTQMEKAHPEIYGDDGVPFWPRSIVVYAQFVPFPGSDEKPDMKWFDSIRDGAWFEEGVMEKPMSQLTAQWIFRDTREYNLPYVWFLPQVFHVHHTDGDEKVKRTYLTNSASLDKSGWVDWVSGRINEAVAPLDNGLWLSVQIQAFGGKHSQFAVNADNGTSYSVSRNPHSLHIHSTLLTSLLLTPVARLNNVHGTRLFPRSLRQSRRRTMASRE